MFQKQIPWDKKTIQKIRNGFFTARYFLRTRDILVSQKNSSYVIMQVFQKNDNAILCGIDEVVSLFTIGCGIYKKKRWQNLRKLVEFRSLKDGDSISANEPVLHITGPYYAFAHLESLYLGILARRTLVATNARRIVKAAAQKPVYFFADRFDHFLNQEGDGYTAHIGGVTGVCTDAHAAWWKGTPIGTMPHSLISLCQGNTVQAATLFIQQYPTIPLIVLVDFHNDCVHTAVQVARIFGKKLWGVRLDTSESIVDISLKNEKGKNFGVCPKLVLAVRHALDKEGYHFVRIIVSGGFTEQKIIQFEKDHVPVDGYGVGSAMLKGNFDFTADIVKINGKEIAKVGRKFHENTRMREQI